MELNKIYNENCLETLARMPDGSIDLTVTSPPYDNLRSYNGYEFDFEPIAQELYRVTKKGGVAVWVVGDATINGSETGTSFKQALYFKEIGFNLHDTMIWHKGSCRFPEINRYYPTFEFMFVVSKGRPKTYNLIEDRRNIYSGDKVARARQIRTVDGDMIANSAFRVDPLRTVKEVGIRLNVWNIAVSSSTDEMLGHPGTFPESLARDHILSWSNENDLIYDPFMGSGTTAKAAHQLKRQWIGSEISSQYVELANKRLEPYLAQDSLF